MLLSESHVTKKLYWWSDYHVRRWSLTFHFFGLSHDMRNTNFMSHMKTRIWLNCIIAFRHDKFQWNWSLNKWCYVILVWFSPYIPFLCKSGAWDLFLTYPSYQLLSTCLFKINHLRPKGFVIIISKRYLPPILQQLFSSILVLITTIFWWIR